MPIRSYDPIQGESLTSWSWGETNDSNREAILIGLLRTKGLTHLGSQQVLAGQPVTFASDRQKIARLMADAIKVS